MKEGLCWTDFISTKVSFSILKIKKQNYFCDSKKFQESVVSLMGSCFWCFLQSTYVFPDSSGLSDDSQSGASHLWPTMIPPRYSPPHKHPDEKPPPYSPWRDCQTLSGVVRRRVCHNGLWKKTRREGRGGAFGGEKRLWTAPRPYDKRLAVQRQDRSHVCRA